MDKVESPSVVITEENLTGLPFLRNLAIGMFNDWDFSDIEETQALMDEIKTIFLIPLVEFDKAYDNFNNNLGVGKKVNMLNDRWRVFLLAFVTELGDESNVTLSKFLDLAKRVFRDAPGGSELFARKLFDGHPSTAPTLGTLPPMRLDYVVLLVLRFYVSSVTQAPPKPVQTAGKAGGK